MPMPLPLLMQLLAPLFRLPRKQKRVVQVLADIVLITASFLLAMLLRLDSWAPITDPRAWLALVVMVPVSLLIFIRLGFYRAIIRYMNQKALQAICAGVGASAVSLAVISYLLHLPVPRSVPFIYAMLALLTIGGVRFGLRALYLNSQLVYKTRVLVYGAGSAGRQLVASLRQGQEYCPMMFVDDARALQRSHIDGLKVYKPSEIERLIQEYGIAKVLLAMPSASRARRRELLAQLEKLNVPIQTIPGVADMVSGKATISEIRDVAVEDLLGRDPVPPNPELMDVNIRGKVVMVTGAGGSIGSELCRQVIMCQPAALLLLDVAEYSLYKIEQELDQLARQYAPHVEVKALLGSVQNSHRNQMILAKFGVQTIYHAAAYKHVPMVEHNVVEGIRNNVFGTLELARAAVRAGVESFVLVSTDKAVRPTNVMGATKRLAELVCQAMAADKPFETTSDPAKTTRFSMVRFGNVLGSSGSVVPLFRRQIERGGPITVTHPEITRYFMTIPEAAQLVIQASGMAQGGDVFVLDMGDPVKIAALACHMVRLSGLEPAIPSTDIMSEDQVAEEQSKGTKLGARTGDIDIIFTGLRPGEKLYEELLIGEQVTGTSHSRIMTAKEVRWDWLRLEALLERLSDACTQQNHMAIRELLLEAPLAYEPQGEIVDLVWEEYSRWPLNVAESTDSDEPVEVLQEAQTAALHATPITRH